MFRIDCLTRPQSWLHSARRNSVTQLHKKYAYRHFFGAGLVLLLITPSFLESQTPPAPTLTPAPDAPTLESLIASALAENPALRAAQYRVEALRSRVSAAGLRADPMLMVGIRDLPVSNPGAFDMSTMKMVGIRQSIPYPGKLGAERNIATREVAAGEAAARAIRLDVIRDVRTAYFEMAFIDQAFSIVTKNRDILVDLTKVTETRYSVGNAEQQDVLRARVEAGRLAEQAVMLAEQRRAELAVLNAALDRPGDTPLVAATVPTRIAQAAVADSSDAVSFVSATLGARAAGSSLPPLLELQATALRNSPELLEQEANISAQSARVDRAGKEHLPDFDIALDYGQRSGYGDMITATVSVPLRIQKHKREDQLMIAAGADLAALEAGLAASRNALRANVARLLSEAERQRAQLALYKTAIIPQGRAAFTSSMTSYQVGRIEFLAVLENQTTLFKYETEYFRVLSDFAKTMSELERVVGQVVLP